MFLIFLVSSAVLRDAISDAQSLRAAETQSMKWLTELRCEVAMNHSFEFIVVKRNRMQCGYRLKTVQQVLATNALNHAVELSLREAIGEQTHSAVRR
jgi:hypothetical protein